MKILIRNSHTIALLDLSKREIRGGWISVTDGVIDGVGEPGQEPEGPFEEILDASGMAVLPGFVNTHHHLFQTLTRALPGATDAELFDWLTTLYPIWEKINRDGVKSAALTGMAELLLSGCTTTSDHHYLFSRNCADPIDATIEAAKEIGIRFHATRGSMCLSEKDGGLPPDTVVQDEKTILADSRRTVEEHHDPSPGAMIRVALAPCSPFSVTRSLMKETADLARSLDVHLHTHLAETKDEEDYCIKHFGKRPLDYLDEVGWLGDSTWLAHGIHFEKAEISRLGSVCCGIAHCPQSNMRLASGIAPTLDLIRAGVRLGLGVDGSASNDNSSLSAEARQALLLGRLKYGAASLTVDEVLRWATRGGASLLGRDDIGRIERGARADLALFPLDDIAFSGAGDAIAAILLCGPLRVHTLLVEGRIVVREGRLETIDLGRLLEAHRAEARRIRE